MKNLGINDNIYHNLLFINKYLISKLLQLLEQIKYINSRFGNNNPTVYIIIK